MIRITFLLWLLALSSGAQAHQNDLVVMLGYRADGNPYNVQWGAGLLVHHDDQRAVVVTARHNLPERDPSSPNYLGEKVYVQFYSSGRADFPAQVIAEDEDDDVDLAVLELRGVDVSPDLFEAARRILVPAGADIVIEHGAVAVGYPNRRAWSQNHSPERIHERIVTTDHQKIRFESSVTGVGMSGGGLFSEHGALLGMVQKDQVDDSWALAIETVAGKLREWLIPFSLEENPKVIRAASRRVLSDLGIRSASQLRDLLDDDPPDFNLLHLFWLAGFEVSEVELLLGSQLDRSDRAFASHVFDRLNATSGCILPGAAGTASRASAAQRELVRAGVEPFKNALGETCAGNAHRWISGLIAGGLDPDLIVASAHYPREALLALAMRSKNAPAVVALLDGGASPNPFQDLTGTEWADPRFLEPLKFVKQDFVGVEQDVLLKRLAASGVVVREAVGGWMGLPPSPGLEDSDSDPICRRATERYDFDWCGYLRSLMPAVNYYIGHQECPQGYCYAKLTHTLSITGDRAWLLGSSQERDFERFGYQRLVVEVTRDPGQWYTYMHGRNYGCTPREDGFESSLCWRKYRAWPRSFRSQAPSAQPANEPSSVVDGLEVEGISLSTPLTRALALLEDAGYTTRTTAGSGSYRDLATTRDYSLRQDGGRRQVKVIAVNERLRALFYEASGPDLIDGEAMVAALDNADLLHYETDESKDGMEVQAVERGPIGKSYLLYRRVHRQPRDPSVDVLLLRRSADKTAPEHSFFERWLHQQLINSEIIGATSERPCVDRYAHLRGNPEAPCQTPRERASSYLEKVGSGREIRKLASGVRYEVLSQGAGPSPKPESRVTCGVSFSYLDDARKGDRLNNWRTVVGEVQWDEIKEALLNMKQGSSWRLYVPPYFGGNDSPYLQITELSLLSVNPQ